jgi:hypothetical protein
MEKMRANQLQHHSQIAMIGPELRRAQGAPRAYPALLTKPFISTTRKL